MAELLAKAAQFLTKHRPIQLSHYIDAPSC